MSRQTIPVGSDSYQLSNAPRGGLKPGTEDAGEVPWRTTTKCKFLELQMREKIAIKRVVQIQSSRKGLKSTAENIRVQRKPPAGSSWRSSFWFTVSVIDFNYLENAGFTHFKGLVFHL